MILTLALWLKFEDAEKSVSFHKSSHRTADIMESKSSRLRDEQQERHRHVFVHVHLLKFCVCAMKVNAWIYAPATDRNLESGLRKSMSVRTRKMVNHA